MPCNTLQSPTSAPSPLKSSVSTITVSEPVVCPGPRPSTATMSIERYFTHIEMPIRRYEHLMTSLEKKTAIVEQELINIDRELATLDKNYRRVWKYDSPFFVPCTDLFRRNSLIIKRIDALDKKKEKLSRRLSRSVQEQKKRLNMTKKDDKNAGKHTLFMAEKRVRHKRQH